MLFSTVAKYSPAQPREPSGGPRGGQFASLANRMANALSQGFDTATTYFHGTVNSLNGDFKVTPDFEFQTPGQRWPYKNESSAIGTWFTSNAGVANSFARDMYSRKESYDPGATIFPVHLSMKNPKVYEGPTVKELKAQKALADKEENTPPWSTSLKYGPEAQKLHAMQKMDPLEQMMDDMDEFATYIDQVSVPGGERVPGASGRGHWRKRMARINTVDAALAFRKSLQDKGYDSIVIKNTAYDAPRKGTQVTQVVVFDAAQIRSVNAQFDPEHKGRVGMMKTDFSKVLKYSSTQPRDPAGTATGGQFTAATVFHGTTEDAYNAAVAEGNLGFTKGKSKGKPTFGGALVSMGGTYVSDVLRSSQLYAIGRSKKLGGEPIVIELQIPEGSLKSDEDSVAIALEHHFYTMKHPNANWASDEEFLKNNPGYEGVLADIRSKMYVPKEGVLFPDTKGLITESMLDTDYHLPPQHRGLTGPTSNFYRKVARQLLKDGVLEGGSTLGTSTNSARYPGGIDLNKANYYVWRRTGLMAGSKSVTAYDHSASGLSEWERVLVQNDPTTKEVTVLKSGVVTVYLVPDAWITNSPVAKMDFATIFKFHNIPFNAAAHPRVPAGSSQGGEFTSGGSNATTTPSVSTHTQRAYQRPEPKPARVVTPRETGPVPESEIPSYGTPVAGAVSVVGTHYSRQPRTFLMGDYWGTGLKGAERRRLDDPDADPRIKKRISFYVDEGNGVVPEAGVGGYPHKVRLNNLYNPVNDKGALWSTGKGNPNESEKAIIDAGYDGYYVADFANKSGIVVLLGKHTVPVVSAPQHWKKASEGYAEVFKRDYVRDKIGRFARTNGQGGGTSKIEALFNEKDDPTLTEEKVMEALPIELQKEIRDLTLKVKNLNKSTDREFAHKDENGNLIFNPERQALHRRIMNKILSAEAIKRATPAKGVAPEFVVLGGRGGSGKSFFTNGTIKEFDGANFLKLDADEIKQELVPPYAGWNAGEVHEESSFIMEQITNTALSMRLNFIHDATMRSAKVAKVIERAHTSGYKVEGHYLFAPRQVSVQRAIKRYIGKGEGKRGRFVPLSVILDNTVNEKNFESLKSKFDKWSVYDNSGSGPVLVERSKAS